MDLLSGKGSTEQKEADHNPVDNSEEEHVLLNFDESSKTLVESTSSSSSSSSSLCEGDFFQLAADVLNKPEPASEQIASNSIESATLQAKAVEAEVWSNGLAVTQSSKVEKGEGDNLNVVKPKVQVMVRTDVPDPYRIPLSVFETTKSTTPVEWSTASNESLFSIHMGNQSFSKDHAILLEKSEELPGLPYPDMLKNSAPLIAQNAANAELMVGVKEKPVMESPSPSPSTPQSRRSDCSTTSISSFVFPILTDGRMVSMKGELDRPYYQHQQQQQPQEPKQPERREHEKHDRASGSAEKSWFSCCFCCC